MDGASEYTLRRLFKIGNIQVDVLRKEYWGKQLGLPYVLVLIKNGNVTQVRGSKWLCQRKASK